MDVEKWVGIFSSDLLQDEVKAFKPNKKFSIEVEDQEIPSDYQGDESNQTIFKGNKFLKSPLIGRWGTSLLESEEDSEVESSVVYKVELVDSETSKNFYIFKNTR